MNFELLFWIYLINAVLLINHEIDSAYWQEWKLFSKKEGMGITGFVLMHIPMVFVVLLGLIWVREQRLAGLIVSMILGLAGIFAFFFHLYHLRKGRKEFNTWLSKGLLIVIIITSFVQVSVTISLFS